MKNKNHTNKKKKASKKRSAADVEIYTEDIFKYAKDIQDTNPMHSDDDSSMDTSENGNDQDHGLHNNNVHNVLNDHNAHNIQSTSPSPSNNGPPSTANSPPEVDKNRAIPDN
jgi:hypothetical protein